jgi:hypothetical protein
MEGHGWWVGPKVAVAVGHIREDWTMGFLFPPWLNGPLTRATCLVLLMAAFIGTSFLAAKTEVGSGPATAKGGAETISSPSQVLLRFAGRP